jgi:hypothetical protein
MPAGAAAAARSSRGDSHLSAQGVLVDVRAAGDEADRAGVRVREVPQVAVTPLNAARDVHPLHQHGQAAGLAAGI